MKVLTLVFLFVAAAFAKHETYSGWKSFYLKPSTQEHLKIIGLMVEVFELDVLSYSSIGREGQVLVKPEHLDGFLSTVEANGLEYRIHFNDLKTLDDIAARYPKVVTLVEPARSFEGRPIKYLKISTTNFRDTSKPVIFIDGGIHAREWISPPTVTWVVKKLVEDVTEPDLLEKFDWIVLPVVNPDGYKYSFSNFRLWRKTRSTDQHSLSSVCPGVDGNRNYDFAFNTVGTSSSPCSDIFPGSRPFSEVETRVVRDIVLQNRQRMALYLTMHSYGSMILYPWGHNGTISSHGLALHRVGIDMANAIHAHKIDYFRNYVVGNSYLVIGYAAAGASEDWAHSVGVTLAYTYELPSLSGGFILDPKYIEQICRETWEGIVAGARSAGNVFGQLK